MIDIKKLRLFPFYTVNLSFTKTDENKYYNIMFYSENSNFLTAYPSLHIKRMFVRYGTILQSKIPRLIVMPKMLSQFYGNKIIPIRYNRNGILNLFIDSSPFMEKLIERFKEGPYRRPMVLNRILSYLESASEYYPDRSNILMYHVDLSKPIPENIYDKRSYPLLMMFKKEVIPYDYVILALQNGNITKFSILKNPDKQILLGRIFSIFRNIRTLELTDDVTNKEKETDNFSKQVTTTVQQNHENENIGKNIEEVSGENAIVDTKMQSSVKTYLQTLEPEERNQIVQRSSIDPVFGQALTIKSAIFNLTRDITRTQQVFKSIDPINYPKVLASIKSEIAPNILEGDVYKNESRDEVFGKININAINENKNPSKILKKRVIDFKSSFESDIKKSFKILESKSKYPLKMIKFQKQLIPINPGDLEPTKLIQYNIILQDYRGKHHEVAIALPEIQSDGSFLINGSKKYLVYQNIKDPIYFIKKGEAALGTMYATVATHHKLTKYKSYFISQISGYWLPTSLMMFYAIGFEKTLKLFNIQYKILDDKPKDSNSKYIETTDKKFLEFISSTKDGHIFINSLFEIKGQIDSTKLILNELWNNLIIKQTGNRNSLHQIGLVIENIMEPISVEILKTKLLPVTFVGCIAYICKGLSEERVDKRNDITKQRIRSSEIFNFEIQKLIIGAYSDYLAKLERGDKDASYYCDTKQIINTIVNTSQMIHPVENINPYEELSSMTTITPIGPGGIGDIHGVTKPARNIDDSYYGNIDPMDTPENDKVGVLNHLTLDAAIGNIRGSFGKFAGIDINSSVLSPATSIIPYVSNDDGCRIMMGTSQTKQAIPILGAEQPLVQTGFETIMTSMLSDSFIKKSPVNGFILRQSPIAIYIKDSKTNRVYTIALDNKILRSYQGKSALNYFHSVVRDGQRVSEGQILAEGKHIQNGVISVGTNLLVAVMGWKGYSFEDGYIISDKIANQKFVSPVYEEITIDIKSTSTIKYIAKNGTETKRGDILLIRASKEVEELLEVEEEEIIEGHYVKSSPGGKIIDIEIYPNVSIKKFPILEPQFLEFKKRWEEIKGSFPEKFLVNEAGNKVPFSGVRVVFKIERYDSCIVGDKITNNHGGKGVITLIEKEENMPITPWGERIQLILNPICIINRMNPGTLYELYTGLVAKFLAKKLVSFGPKRTPQAMKLLAETYSALDNTKGKSLSKNIIRSFLSLSDKQYADYIIKIQKNDYFLPIIVPPFQSPTKEMISNSMKIVGVQSAYKLKLPEYNTLTKNPVAVGYLYYKKLEKQAGYLLSARSIGKYESKTGQPNAGTSHGGGQRLGEFDTWAIISHGAETLLKEILGPLSDDKKTKDEILYEIMQKGEASYRDSRVSTVKSRLDIYLTSMMLNTGL